MTDVFVSYASDDRPRVEGLVKHLQSEGFTVWWDRDLHGGTVFSEKIEAEVHRAKVVVVVWTDTSVRSQWVADEADLGRRHGKLLPLRLDEIDPPMGFRQIHTIDFTTWNGGIDHSVVKDLTGAIEHHTGQKAKSRQKQNAASDDVSPPDASIAVLPFVNNSSDPEQEYFSDGISEELLNLLSKIKQMRVTARTSSFAFKGTDKRVSEIGNALGVAHVMEGSVRKAGNRVRITAQMVEAASEFHLWAETYDRTLDDIFAIQDEISAAIVDALKKHFLDDVNAPESNRSDSIEAYELYLFGQQLLNKRTNESITKGKEFFERALKIDPTFGPAMVALADAHLLLSDFSGCYGTVPAEQASAEAVTLLQTALKLNPDMEEAYAILSLKAHFDGDVTEAREFAERAIALNPNLARAYRVLSFALKRSGDPAAPIISTREKALQLDPVSTVDLYNLAVQFSERHRYDDARDLLAKIKTIDHHSLFCELGEALIALFEGRLCDALGYYAKNKDLWQTANGRYILQHILPPLGHGQVIEHMNPSDALYFYCILGDTENSDRLGKKLKESIGDEFDYDVATSLAMWHGYAGRYDASAKYLKPFEENDPKAWGRHFDLDLDCIGARLSYLTCLNNDDGAGADHYAKKLAELYRALKADHDGHHSMTHHIGAIVALCNGNEEEALDCIEDQVEAWPLSGLELAHDPFLARLREKPRFIKAVETSRAHVEKEREAAKAAGYLPLSDDLVALTRD